MKPVLIGISTPLKRAVRQAFGILLNRFTAPDGAVEAHLVESIRRAPVRSEPAPHIFVEDAFPEAYYRDIISGLSAVSHVLTPQVHTGDPKAFFGSYAQRLESHVPRDLIRMNLGAALFWNGLFNILSGAPVFAAFKAKFIAGFRARFGEAAERPGFREGMRPNMLLTKHLPDYYLGPHTDRFEKVITCVFNCPERAGLEHLGTAIYEPKEAGFTCRGSAHHDPARFHVKGKVPFAQNSALIFFRDDRLFHGVERLTKDELGGSERPNIQFNLWES